MRAKICSLIAFSMIMTISCQLLAIDKLSASAEYIKEKYSWQYEQTIKFHALQKWGDDFSMVVFEISTQCDNFVAFIGAFEPEYSTIFVKAIANWVYPGFEEDLQKKMKNGLDPKDSLETLLSLHVDWSMANFEYKKQVKAKKALQ